MVNLRRLEELLQQVEILLSYSLAHEEGVRTLLAGSIHQHSYAHAVLSDLSARYYTYHKVWQTLHDVLKQAIEMGSREPTVIASPHAIKEIDQIVQRAIVANMQIQQLPAITGQLVIEK